MGGLLRGVAAVAAASALLAAPAQARVEQADATVSGAVTVSWRADGARGCEAAGLCGYSGSLTWQPGEQAEISFVPHFGPALFLESDAAAIVRVRRDGGATCVDAVPGDFFAFETRKLGTDRYALRFPEELSSGRCAGPSAADIASALPAATIDLGAMRRGGTRLAWPGGPLAAGPWTGEVTSTLAARLSRLRRPRANRTTRPRVPARLRGRTLYRTSVDYAYRVTAVHGGLDVAFHGLAPSECVALDACGVTGTVSLVPPSKGTLDIGGAVESVKPDKPVDELYVTGDLRSGGRVSEVLHRPGAPDCAEARTTGHVLLGGEAGRSRVDVTLGAEHVAGLELMRTRCPGPTHADVFARGALARAEIARTSLGSRHLRLTLRVGGTFAGAGYAGTRTGTVTLDLERVRARVRHSRRTL